MSTYGKQISEIDFIEQLRQGDNGGFEILYDRYSAMLFGIILRVVNDNEDAENLLQDCFVKIWKNIASYDATKGRLATWMINVARNTAIDFYSLKGLFPTKTQPKHRKWRQFYPRSKPFSHSNGHHRAATNSE